MSVINKSSAVPYYQQLAELLRQDIAAHQPASGGIYPLPSENVLAERHGLNRATVRHALDVLEREGLIYREKGKGAFAATRRVEQELTRLESTTAMMQQRGWNLVTRVISICQMPAPQPAAQALELAAGSLVYELQRLRIVDEVPLSLQTVYLPAHLCPQLEGNDLNSSLYRLLETRYGLLLWSGHETLRARGATKTEARLLQVRIGTPVMYSERVSYSPKGIPVEYLEAAWRGDRYDFKVTLARPIT